MKKGFWLIVLLAMILSACTSAPQSVDEFQFTLEPTLVIENTLEVTATPPAYLPQPGDSELNRANALTNSIYLLYTDSDPAEVVMHIVGYLPTPCHELRIDVPPPNEENIINVQIYALTEPDIECEQVLRAYDTRVILGTYPPGSYWVWVNGGRVGNFDY